MNRPGFAVVPFVLAVSACVTPKPPRDVPGDLTHDSPDSPARVEIGTGQLGWEPIAATGTRVELIHGPQGGYHLFGRVRFETLGPDVYVTFRVTPAAGGAPLNDSTERLHLVEGRGLSRTGATWESSSPLLVVLVAVRNPAAVVGQRFVFEATVAASPATPEAPRASVSREIVIVDET